MSVLVLLMDSLLSFVKTLTLMYLLPPDSLILRFKGISFGMHRVHVTFIFIFILLLTWPTVWMYPMTVYLQLTTGGSTTSSSLTLLNCGPDLLPLRALLMRWPTVSSLQIQIFALASEPGDCPICAFFPLSRHCGLRSVVHLPNCKWSSVPLWHHVSTSVTRFNHFLIAQSVW